jgi:hypothetical protein
MDHTMQKPINFLPKRRQFIFSTCSGFQLEEFAENELINVYHLLVDIRQRFIHLITASRAPP